MQYYLRTNNIASNTTRSFHTFCTTPSSSSENSTSTTVAQQHTMYSSVANPFQGKQGRVGALNPITNRIFWSPRGGLRRHLWCYPINRGCGAHRYSGAWLVGLHLVSHLRNRAILVPNRTSSAEWGCSSMPPS